MPGSKTDSPTTWLHVTVRIGLVVVIITRGRLPPTESANSPTTRLGLAIVIIRRGRLSPTESAIIYGAAVVGAYAVRYSRMIA